MRVFRDLSSGVSERSEARVRGGTRAMASSVMDFSVVPSFDERRHETNGVLGSFKMRIHDNGYYVAHGGNRRILTKMDDLVKGSSCFN